MSQRSQHRGNGSARPIKTKRDYMQVGNVVKQLNEQVERESAAELRLQALIREMEKFDGEDEDDFDPDFSFELENGAQRRRWSDDPNDLD